MSLTTERRYVVVDGVEGWTQKQAAEVIAGLVDLPPDLTVVLVAHERPPKVRAPKGLAGAVEKAGGEVLTYAAPKARDLPGWLAREAKRRGFELDADAAGLLVERMGESTVRLGTELDRLALWAEGGSVTRGDLEAMVADTSEEVAWALSDAIVARDPLAAQAAVERLAGQGESVTGLVYQAAKRLREAHLALSALEAGRSAKEVEAELPMHPYAAKMLLRRLRDASLEDLQAASCAIADLEWWTRGGSDYPEPIALTLAVRRAAGG
jgi:DNA polymerase-3 subunit delta